MCGAAEDFQRIGFEVLGSFEFTTPDWKSGKADDLVPPAGLEQFPETVKKLDGQKVAITGFMLPIKLDGGLVTEFLLMRDPSMCCYGVIPAITDWVVVRMKGKGVKALMDYPVGVVGVMQVGAQWESGYVTGIYRIDGERTLGLD